MTVSKLRRPDDADDKALDDLRRLGQRVSELRTQDGAKDMSRALALLDDAQAIRNVLVVRARELGDRMRFLRKGLAARAAYRQTTNLVPGRLSGERK